MGAIQMDIKQLIGARLKAIRTSKDMTQEELAEKVDINPKYLSSIERGKENPTLNTFIRLSNELSVDLGTIFYLLEAEDPNKSRKLIREKIKKANGEQLKLISMILDLSV